MIEKQYKDIRKRTKDICNQLQTEDYSVQPTDFVSPPKWHLAHSTWFFEEFVLKEFSKNYKSYSEDFAYLFNSYYNNAGKRVLRPNRGLMTRPTVEEVYKYRDFIDAQMAIFLDGNPSDKALNIIELGMHHEQQHQELLIYDIKYILGHQPTFPVLKNIISLTKISNPSKFISVKEGIYTIGHQGKDFCFDNELGQHKVYLNDFQISNNLVKNSEYIEFLEDGGYQNFNLWHAEAWDYIQENNIIAPLYWHKVGKDWWYYTLDGFTLIEPSKPVVHVSFYEAFAFAEWKKMRLPTEFEWEVASSQLNYGELWEWTNSAYLPYPNFKKAPGALGEYNGKFMINQMVLRGGSNATPIGHIRSTYRNFFQAKIRWQFAGIRLVK